MIRSDLSNLDMSKVAKHYEGRLDASKQVSSLLRAGDARKFARCALGIANPLANYSANEHRLGPMVLSNASPNQIEALANRISECRTSRALVDCIYQAKIAYLKISVGTEIAMMLDPDRHWVANTRSVWAHLLVKHEFNYRIASEELKLYRDDDESSEMAYRKWGQIHQVMHGNLVKLGQLGDCQAVKAKISVGAARNIWFDAIANAIYEES